MICCKVRDKIEKHAVTRKIEDEALRKWSLPADYPMVAPNYAAIRSALAKQMGLGRKSQKAGSSPPRGRRKAAA